MWKKEELTLKQWFEKNYNAFHPSESEMARIEITETGIAKEVKKGGMEAIKTKLSNIMIYSRRELAKLNLSFVKDVNNPKRKRGKEIGYLYIAR